MPIARGTPRDHRLLVDGLRSGNAVHIDARYAALHRAVIECLRNPVVARAVARGLRLHEFEKP